MRRRSGRAARRGRLARWAGALVSLAARLKVLAERAVQKDRARGGVRSPGGADALLSSSWFREHCFQASTTPHLEQQVEEARADRADDEAGQRDKKGPQHNLPRGDRLLCLIL